MKIEQFVERHNVKLSYQSVPANPHWPGADGASHYHCTLTVGARSMSLYYSKGAGLRVWKVGAAQLNGYQRPKGWKKGEHAPAPFRPTVYEKEAFEAWTEPEAPTVSEILDCMAADASSVDNCRSFEEWADELGMDQDSRKAEAAYRACVAQANDLRKLLGSADYNVLLQEVERS